MLVSANNKTLHILIFFAMCGLFFSASAASQAQQQAPDKSTPAASTDRNACPGSLQVCWSGDLQDLSRGHLQRLGENAALEDHTK